jgi:hypothetical protein
MAARYDFDFLTDEENVLVNETTSWLMSPDGLENYYRGRENNRSQETALRVAMRDVFRIRAYSFGGLEAETLYDRLWRSEKLEPRQAYKIIERMDWPRHRLRQIYYDVVAQWEEEALGAQEVLETAFANNKDLDIRTVWSIFYQCYLDVGDGMPVNNGAFWGVVADLTEDECLVRRQQIQDSIPQAPFGGG